MEQALKDADIPVVSNDAVAGAWLTSRLGVRFERSQLFVTYAFLDRATEIMNEMFAGKDEFTDFEFETEDPT